MVNAGGIKSMTEFIDNIFACEGNRDLYFVKVPDEPWVGVTIIDHKSLKKRKGWQHILLEKEPLTKLRDYISQPPYNAIGYFECRCTSEILRIVHEDNFFYVDIFDNGALKLKSGIKTSTFFNEKDAPELERILNNMLNLFE